MNHLQRYGRHTVYRMKQKYREDPFAFIVLWLLFLSMIFLVFAFRGLIAVNFMGKINIDPNATMNVISNTDNSTTNTISNQTSTTNSTINQVAIDNSTASIVADSGQTYTVKNGDTVYALGLKLNKDWNQIASLNNLSAPYALKVGQILKLPQ